MGADQHKSARWKDFVKSSASAGFGMAEQELGAGVGLPRMAYGRPAGRQPPGIYADRRASPAVRADELRPAGGEAFPMDPRLNDRDVGGLYGMLGAPGLQRSLNRADEVAQSHGTALDKAMAAGAKMPERVVGAVGAGAVGGAVGPYAAAAGRAVGNVAGKAAWPFKAVWSRIGNSSLGKGAGKAYGFLQRWRLPISIVSGAKEGTREGIDRGSVSDGVAGFLEGASAPYMMLGGGLLPTVASSGVSRYLRDAGAGEPQREAIKNGLRQSGLNALWAKLYQKFPFLAFTASEAMKFKDEYNDAYNAAVEAANKKRREGRGWGRSER